MSDSCNPKDCSPAVYGISQAWILECISFSGGFSQPRDQTHISCIGRQMLYHCAPWEAQQTSIGTCFHFAHFCKLGHVDQEFWKIYRVQLDSEGKSVALVWMAPRTWASLGYHGAGWRNSAVNRGRNLKLRGCLVCAWSVFSCERPGNRGPQSVLICCSALHHPAYICVQFVLFFQLGYSRLSLFLFLTQQWAGFSFECRMLWENFTLFVLTCVFFSFTF